MTATETVLRALLARLQTLEGAAGPKILRNAERPERVPHGGLVVLWDGDPGEPDEALGGEGPFYAAHVAELWLGVQAGDPFQRETRFDDLVAAVAGALDADPTLGGAVFGMTYSRPAPEAEALDGAADIKAGIVDVTLEYQTASRMG